MAVKFLKDCTDPAELAERLRVLNGPDADAIDPGMALRREAATITIPAGAIGPDGFVQITAKIGGGNG